ncbi:hypothetical protein G7085_17940 [Tessaracoccus sp. HDW20]|nr:hypothetical protein [Tessaracoccus coleopterorum]NHB85811.1 hypothetical protein [Tessaracoccus coleopterorum]
MTFTIQNHGKAQLFNARAVIGEGQSLARQRRSSAPSSRERAAAST